MALSHSPQVVTNGLVYYHDMGNTQKSWKGAPTTNLATTQTLVNHSLVTLPTFSDAPEKGAGWKKVIVTATSSNFRMLKMDVFNVAANSTTTYSIEFECSNSEVYLNIDGTGFGGGAWTKIGPTRYSRTVTTATAGAAYLFVNSNNLSASVNYVIYYKEHQIESGSFATPYVVGTRSNTQAIVDLTGTNTVTATSLTYASDNTFSFNGSTNQFSTGYSTALTNFTIGVWFKALGITSGYDRIIDNYYVNGTMLMRNAASANSWGGGVLEGTAPYGRFLTLADGQWHYLVSVRQGTTHILYGDGITNTVSGTVSATALNAQPFAIGGWYDNVTNQRFNGSIPVAQIYNRALSAAEVLQNYNALRGRYGL